MGFDFRELKQKKSKDDNNSGSRSSYLDWHGIEMKKMEDYAGPLPKEGECLDLISLKSFNAYTIILWIVAKVICIDELYVSSYSLSRDVCDGLFGLYTSGKVNGFHLMLSDSLRQRNPYVAEQAERIASSDGNCKVVYGWTHQKTALCRTKGNRFLVVTGSGNFSRNAQYENYIIRNDERVYNFYKNWFLNAELK